MGRRPWWAALCAISAVALLWVPQWTNPFTDITEATWQLAILSLVVAGWVSLGRASQHANGTLMLILAVTASATSLQSVGWGPWAWIGTVLYPMTGILLGVLVLRWPRDRLGSPRAQRWLIWIAWVVMPVLTVASNLGYRPPERYFARAWWPTVAALRGADYGLYNATQGAEAVLLVAFVALVAVRIVRASRPERRQLAPVTLAAAFFAALAVVNAIELLADANVPGLVDWLSNLSVMAVPLSFLVAVAVRRIQRALAVEALLDSQRLTSADVVERVLGRALGDRSLALAVWSPEQERYLLSDGTAAPDETGHAHTVYATSPVDGAPLARIGIAARLAGQTDFVESVLRAAGTALDNARLQAELRSEQRAVQQSRRRLTHAEAAQQRMTRLLPGGLAERLSHDPDAFTSTELLTVTVLISDIRGYTTLAETAPPERIAAQLNEHRQAMNDAVLTHGGTVMQYVGDAVMAVFGAPEPLDGHEGQALAAAAQMHTSQEKLNTAWAERGLPPFGLGIGLSTGPVAAALLGSRDRVEYTLVGDTVNLASRLCDAARPAGSTVASAATIGGHGPADGYELLSVLRVKGRTAAVTAYRRPPSRPDQETPKSRPVSPAGTSEWVR